MSAIASFSSTEFKELKIWVDDEKREFYRAIDVCYALKHSNPSQALSRLVDDDFIFQIDDGSNRAGKVNYLSEPGLYQLIFASKTEQAKNFQRWVFTKVLPKLRASGGYIMPNATSKQLQALKTEIAEMEKEIKRITQLNKEVSEIDAKLVFIIKGIVDKLLEQACQLQPKGTGKHWRAYTAYWDTLYALKPMLDEIFPMELCTKQCFDETLMDEKVTELFDVIALKTQDMKWDVNYVAYKKFNMSEN